MRHERSTPARVRPLILALALFASAGPATAAPLTICDGTTAVTLLGLDTSSGKMLFSIPPLGERGKPWIVELDPAGNEARAWPDPPKGLFAGSAGPGPVVAAVPCGPSCFQPMRWAGGSWEPLGESLSLPIAANITPTYDHTGTPWIVVHGKAAAEGAVQAWAFRLKGQEWESRGGLAVSAVGQPAALPAPQRKDGIISGTGLFSASGLPEAWVSGVPNLPAARRGQVVALTGTSAAYLSGDGVVYLSEDSGKSWRRSTWTPWGATGTAGLWRQGKEYWVDLPFGDHRGALRLVWFDRRRPSEEKLLLTRLAQSGDWLKLVETRSDIHSKNGDRLPIDQVFVPQGDTWVLLSGCAATAEGSGFVLRTFDGTALSAAKFVPLQGSP